MKLTIWSAFGLMVLIQLFVPIQMIWEKEAVLTKGVYYKFQTAPIDPNNPFIGKYIILDFKEAEYKMPSSQAPSGDKHIYVTFKPNRNGFAVIDRIFEKAPSQVDYLKTTIRYSSEEKDITTVSVNYPFDRFYMEESKAPEAETYYQERNIDSANKVYALVALYKGDASVKNVFINDTSITDMLKFQRQQRIRTK